MGSGNWDSVHCIVKGTLRKRKQLMQQLQQLPHCTIKTTVYAGHASELALESAQQGADSIIAVGGDGTAHEVLNGLMAANTSHSPRLGILSGGTANDFIRTAELTGGVQQLTELLDQQSSRTIDIGRITYQTSVQRHETKYFLNIADLGLGASVVQKVGRMPSWIGAGVAYNSAIVATLAKYRNVPVQCHSEGFSWSGNIKLLAVANGRCFGNGIWIAPQASIDSRRLQVAIIGDISLLDYAQQQKKLKSAMLIDHPEVSYLEVDWLEVNPVEHELPLEADGEFLGFGPARFDAIPAAIDLIAPASK